jgi:hypothetical protein
MTDHWDFYMAQVDGKPASVFLDMGIRDHTPDPDRAHLHWLFLRLTHPNPHGMTTTAESQILGDVEDALGSEILLGGTVFVGRITTDGRREFYYYARTGSSIEPGIQKVLRGWPQYEYQYGTKPDANWTQYLKRLYPPPEERQRIGNRQVIEALKKAGDSFEVPRPVSHWAYFTDPAKRDTFTARMHGLGYKAERSQEDGEERLGVSVEKQDSAATIDETVTAVFRAATELGGEYDGWESPVISPVPTKKPPFWHRFLGRG